MDVLVTGATGRIGANTVKHLLKLGHRVRAVVRPGSDRAEKLREMSVETVAVDLQDREALAAMVEGVEAIVHLGVKLRGPSNWDHLDVNVAPTLTQSGSLLPHSKLPPSTTAWPCAQTGSSRIRRPDCRKEC